MLVAAFRGDPSLRYFFPEESAYRVQAAEFFGYLFDKRVVLDTVWCTADLSAAALWTPPAASVNVDHRNLANELRPSLVEAIGRDASARLDAYEAAVDQLLPADHNHWYLGVLGTNPSSSRNGYGRAVMDAGLALARSEHVDAYLETTNLANVAFYERRGWTVVGHVDYPLPTWALRSQ